VIGQKQDILDVSLIFRLDLYEARMDSFFSDLINIFDDADGFFSENRHVLL
jgi:hypothetical protein